MRTYSFPPELFTIDAAAHYLGISKRTVEEYIIKGMIHTFRLPGTGEGEYLRRTHIRKSELDSFIKRGITV